MAPSKTKTKTGWQYMYFGYLVREEWLLEYGVRNNLLPDMTGKNPDEVDEVASVISAAIIDVMAKARLFFPSKLGTVLSYDKKSSYCLVLATNKPGENLPLPPPAKWARLKEILETSEEPHWYLAFA